MSVYLILFFICLLATVKKKPSKIGDFLILALLFIISACRGENVGIDTIAYYNNLIVSYQGDNHSYEFLFMWICELIRNNNIDPRCCLYFLSFVTFLFIFLASKRYNVGISEVCFYYVLFIFYFHSLNIARQMASCSILLYAYSFLFFDENITERKRSLNFFNILIYIALVFLASSIHVGAIVGLLGLIVTFIHDDKVNFSFTSITILLLSLFALIQVGRSFLWSNTIGLLSSIDVYGSVGEGTRETSLSIGGFIYRSIAYLFHGYVLVSLYNDRYFKIGNLFFVSILLTIILSGLYGSVSRAGLYFSIVYIIAYSYCFTSNNKGRRNIFLLMVLYFGIDYFLIIKGNTFGLVPYVFNMVKL